MAAKPSSADLDPRNRLRAVPFFVDLPEPAVTAAIAQGVIRPHPADQVMLLESDWGNAVYFILEGWMKIRTYNLEGREITLNILGPGELFGEMASLDQVPRSTDVMTLTPALIGSIPAADFVKFLTTEPQAGIRLAKLMAQRLRQLNRRLRLREADSTARVVDILLFLAEGQGRVSETGTAIPLLAHRELGSLAGMTRETVTRVLGKLERKGLIRRDGETLHLVNIKALEALLV